MKAVPFLSVALPCLLLAQAPPAANTAKHQEAMKKLAFLAGKWEGSGWMRFGPGPKHTVRQAESVQLKQNGVLMLIEGLGKAEDNGRVVHDALAVVSFDEASGGYRMRAWAGAGRSIDAEVKAAGENTMEWGYRMGPATIRYLIRLNENGDWHETGESTVDGKTWTQFFEMTLKRVANP